MTTADKTPLTAEEAALAEIYRRLPDGEPAPALDTRIRAQAHAAVHRTQRTRWPWGAAVAAALALGIGLQVIRSPLNADYEAAPMPGMVATAPADAARQSARMSADVAEIATEAAPAPAPATAPAAAAPPVPMLRRQAPKPSVVMPAEKTAEPMASPPPPPPAPAAPAPFPPSAMQAARAPAEKSRAVPSTSEREHATHSMQDRADSLRMAAPTTAAPTRELDVLIEQAREHHRQGDEDALHAVLRRLQREYPQADLPDELRDWIADLPAEH